MTILQDAKQSIAIKKAERDSDKAEAMREYQAERLAAQANMARLRALRLAKESADQRPPEAARHAPKRKAASR